MQRPVDTDTAVLERLVAPAGKDVLDVGCGSGGLVRWLAGRGARPTGMEISEGQLAAALRADDGSGIQYVVGSGQDLPFADGALDAVLFMRSLHHVPVDLMGPALAEARRVLRPGGLAYVVEPLAEGDFFAVTTLVEDEREVRAAAQLVVADCARAGLRSAGSEQYDVEVRLAGVDALRARLVSVDPERAAGFDARRPELEAALTAGGEPLGDGGRRFRQPMKADVLRPQAVLGDG